MLKESMSIRIRYRLSALAVALSLACVSALAGDGGTRTHINLNGRWQFALDPRGALSPAAAFSETIQVPGCWQAQGFGTRFGILRHVLGEHRLATRS